MIPKKIFTCWLSENPVIPPFYQKCIETQKIPGYEHHTITLENCDRRARYVQDAIKAKRWVKASDYLRVQYVHDFGGIFVDADMEILPEKNFDDLLDCRLFTSNETSKFEGGGLVANSAFGAEPGNPILKGYLERVENNYRGDGDLVFQPGIAAFHDCFWGLDRRAHGITWCPTEMFFPYNHQTNQINITEKTKIFHHFSRSWLGEPKLLPSISFLVPTLGRPEGLKRCLDSIKKLNYPATLTEVLVLEDEPRKGVAARVKELAEKATGDFMVYASNDIEFSPNSVIEAVNSGRKYVAFNTGDLLPDEGNANEHFMIHRSLVEKLNFEIFDLEFAHVGTDNLLMAKMKKLGEFFRCPTATVKHYHFTRGAEFDEVYRIGWESESVKKDRELLAKKLSEL